MITICGGKEKVFSQWDETLEKWCIMVKFVRSGVITDALMPTDVFYEFPPTFSTKSEAETWIKEHCEEVV